MGTAIKHNALTCMPAQGMLHPDDSVTAVGANIYEFPLSTAQESFWFLDRLSPGNQAYNIAVRFRLQGPLDPALLECALNALLCRHETLRTTFELIDEEPRQIVHPSMTISLPLTDISHLSQPERDAAEERLTLEEARRPFDLAAGPLLRAQILQLGPQDCMLLLTVHHIVSDGWSIGIITDELGALYQALSVGSKNRLPDPQIQYADFAVWQHELRDSDQTIRQLSYWRKHLEGFCPLDVPTDSPRRSRQTFNGNILSRLLPRDLTDRLCELSTREDCTLFMTSAAALDTILHLRSGQTDISIGTILAGRTRVEMEQIIGPFINPTVLRADLAGDPTFLELLNRVRAATLDAIANQDVPFERVVKAVNPGRAANRHAMFDVNFIYQRDFVRPLEFAGVKLTPVPSKSPGAIYDLNFFMVERADGWRLSCEYNTDLFRGSTVDQMLWQLAALLRTIADAPATHISQLCSQVERQWLDERRDFTMETDSSTSVRAFSLPLQQAFVAPRNDTEARVARIWQNLLDRRPISVTANFFEVGGHSLLAAKMLTRIQNTFGKKLPLTMLFEAPTIADLAAVIRDESGLIVPPVLNAIQPMGSKPPLFWMDGYSRMIPLANALGEERPFLGVPLRAIGDLPTPFQIRDIASAVVRIIRKVQPEGPYHLGGWCFPGLIAYAVACELQEQGQEVAFLAMVDTRNPTHFRRQTGIAVIGLRLRYHVAKAVELGMRDARVYVVELVKTRFSNLIRSVYRLNYRLHLRFRLPLLPAVRRPGEVAYLALAAYEPKRYSGRLILVRNVARSDEPHVDRQLGWDELVDDVDVVECPGDHITLFEGPNATALAKALKIRLDDNAGSELSRH
jgi:thioesterase domain-containing protein/acyl carrier protein